MAETCHWSCSRRSGTGCVDEGEATRVGSEPTRGNPDGGKARGGAAYAAAKPPARTPARATGPSAWCLRTDAAPGNFTREKCHRHFRVPLSRLPDAPRPCRARRESQRLPALPHALHAVQGCLSGVRGMRFHGVRGGCFTPEPSGRKNCTAGLFGAIPNRRVVWSLCSMFRSAMMIGGERETWATRRSRRCPWTSRTSAREARRSLDFAMARVFLGTRPSFLHARPRSGLRSRRNPWHHAR